jgi:DNA-binding PadR family transcriptional regulator
MSVFCTVRRGALTEEPRGAKTGGTVENRSLRPAPPAESTSRFELAPPRRFILPAILLLLSEQPGYGYALAPRLQELRFGHVDRPAIYRALAQLEADGLVVGAAEADSARQARRVYRVTALGDRVLRVWMGVVKEEHDQLEHVLRRYQATGTADAVLAEVEGGWAGALGYGWSPVASTSAARPRLRPLAPDHALDWDADLSGMGWTEVAAGTPRCGGESGEDGSLDSAPNLGVPSARLSRFVLVPDRSVVLIGVRSTVGPLSFGSIGVTGSIEAALNDGVVDHSVSPSARIRIDVSGLRSGNRLYDAELRRRIDADRFPTATVELRECGHPTPGNRYRLAGELTFHGVTRPTSGTVKVEAEADGRLVITGEQAFDIRDFAIPSPTVLMLRIYPDVRVRLHAEADLEDAT